MDRYFFEIPIFRLDLKSWGFEQEREVTKLAQRLAKNAGAKEATSYELDYARKWTEPEFPTYRYGEMIGMIRLYALNRQIRGEYFLVESKRISRRTLKKKWKYYGKLFEFMVHDQYSNFEIFELIVLRIKESKKSSNLLKNRHIDLESFLNAGPRLDLRNMAYISN